MLDIGNLIGRKFLTQDNPRVCCPPGPILPGEGPFVMVATVMRAGTHLLIDSILNNFPRTRRSPLYVDLDSIPNDRIPGTAVVGRIRCEDSLPPGGGWRDERSPLVEAVARQSRILTINRDPKASYRSTRAWLEAESNVSRMMSVAESEDIYYESLRRFNEFWARFEHLPIDFHDLTNPQSQPETIRKIGEWIGQEPRSPMIYPYPKTAKLKVYSAKALTRLFGRHAPVVNTTIRFGKTAAPDKKPQ